MSREGSTRLRCPFCKGYDVERLYLASLQLDSCACQECGARWEESRSTGEYLGRGGRAKLRRRPD